MNRKQQAAKKRRICRELKRAGISKKELAEIIGCHYQTVKWALNPAYPGWSEMVITAAEQQLNAVI